MRDLWAKAFMLIAAFAAVVQWSVPHGWMLGADDAGRTVLMPCPGTSPALAALGGKGSGQSSHHDHGHHNHGQHHDHAFHAAPSPHDDGSDGPEHLAETLCDSAAVGAPVVLPEFPQIVAMAQTIPAISGIALTVAPGRGLAAPPPPSTGPPSPVKL